MFGVPVRVHPMFWVFSALLGWDLVQGENRLQLLFLWIACVFVSILLHEFGHVFMGMLCGARGGYIVLYAFGGLAIGSNALANRWKRIAVSLAGPAIQLVLYGVLWELLQTGVIRPRGLHPVALWVLKFLMAINFYWPILNLLPIWPLDGGKVTRELCDWFFPGRGVRLALGFSMFVGGLIAINAIAGQSERAFLPDFAPVGQYTAILFGLLAFSNFMELQQLGRGSGSLPDDEHYWESRRDRWRDG
jgi:Zn-dependent protease